MKKRGVGLLLVLTIIIAAGTLGQDLRFDKSIRHERAVTDARDRDVRLLELALAELRAAQAGYIATGQSPQHWMDQVSRLTSAITTEIDRLRASTISEEARTRYQAAASALSDFTNIDSRARRHVADNQNFLASDLVFIDSLEATQRAAAELDQARALERAASDTTVTRMTWLRFGMNSLALGFMLVVALVAVRSSFRDDLPGLIRDEGDERPDVERAGDGAAPVDGDADLDRDEYAVVVARTSVHRTAEPARAATSAPAVPVAAVETPPAASAGPSAALGEAAELCADLARLMDGRDLPALVERTSGVLGARGVVLWAAEPGTGMLRPALTHGYSERVVKRLGTLPVDGDNVTSLAYRSMQTQIMKGQGAEASGAVAVPLVTTAGCVGVLAAETREREPGGDLLALARILAAQFSTVVQPAPIEVVEARAAKGVEA